HVAGHIAAAALVEPLPESREHDVPDAAQSVPTAHRFRGRFEEPPGGIFLRRGRRGENEPGGRRARGYAEGASKTHEDPLPRMSGTDGASRRLLEAKNIVVGGRLHVPLPVLSPDLRPRPTVHVG